MAGNLSAANPVHARESHADVPCFKFSVKLFLGSTAHASRKISNDSVCSGFAIGPVLFRSRDRALSDTDQLTVMILRYFQTKPSQLAHTAIRVW